MELLSRQDLIIVDTAPIRDLVAFRAVDEFGLKSLGRYLKDIKDRRSYERCSEFISSFRNKTTSAGVVVELNYWIRNTGHSPSTGLWGVLCEEFNSMGMDEEVVKLLEINRDFLTEFGPVDASLIEIARRHSSRYPMILASDGKLAGKCKNISDRIRVSSVIEVCVH